MKPKVKYCGTFMDYSGYGQANRSYIAALYTAGVDVSTELVVQVPERAQFGWVGALADSMVDRQNDYRIKVIHLTPDMYARYMEDGKYHVGHLFWETDRLPAPWVEPCNKMNEIWTASEKQAKMIKNSGVKVPIYTFPQAINIYPPRNQFPYKINRTADFVFYAIFQWIERKNPKALLQTYWKTFSGNDKVVLMLKTYRVNYSGNEFETIKREISEWKAELGLEHYPRVLLIRKLFDTEGLFRFHETGDCFITTSRGEGWCIPAVEAMLSGNPVIGLDQTGFADYMNEEMYYPCRAKETQVTEQTWIPWYTSDQKWLDINTEDLSKQMLAVYNERDKAKTKGSNAKQFVTENFNYWAVGNALKTRLEQIEKFI